MKLITFFLFFWPVAGFAQSVALGARSIALSGVESLAREDAGTTFLNPANLVMAPKFSFWGNYYHPFNLPELKVQAGAVNYTRRPIALGLGFAEVGNAILHERFYVLSFAFSVTKDLATGLKLKQRGLAIQKYGSAHQYAADLGLRVRANKYLSLAVLIKNLFSTRLGKSDEKLLRQISSGVAVHFPHRLELFFELSQVQFFAPMARLAFSFQPISFFYLRAGTGLNAPNLFSAGFGLSYAHLRLDYALQNHPYLQPSHVFSVSLEVGS
ncbi:MAG: hypothetical protein D6814_18130 [Calditrichaeota bacterium]|nr:MAG: hypothetical protein D6814_18130 [Calditrichota bacterium]